MPSESTDEESSSTLNVAGQSNHGSLEDSVEGSEGPVQVVLIKSIVAEMRGLLTLLRKNEVFIPGADVALMIASVACLQWPDGQMIELLRTDIVAN